MSYLSYSQQGPTELTENFAFNVKTIDDFFERFNYVRGTEFEKFISENYPGASLQRTDLILSLFNRSNVSFKNNLLVKDFLVEVCDSLNPKHINFLDSGWFASVECMVRFESKMQPLNLVLKVDKSINSSSKWSIVSAHADFLLRTDTNTNTYFNSTDSVHFIHPVSHALDFMNLDLVFASQNDFHRYLNESYRSEELSNLNSLVEAGRVKFIRVDKTEYHFLQINNWILRVEYINRKERNSGWLINELIRTDKTGKQKYMEEKLHFK